MTKKQSKEIKQAETMIMQAQMSPHFFYNAMLSIKSLIKDDPDKATDAIDWLLNYTRESADLMACNSLIPFTKEIELVENYLNLEKIRFGDKIEFEFLINEENFLIPPMSLQPLVENSIRHGIRKRPDGCGKIRIETGQTDKEYLIEVKDNGVGFDVNAPLSDDRTHMGLSNTIKRIENQCNGHVVLHSKKNKGSTVIIYIPFGD